MPRRREHNQHAKELIQGVPARTVDKVNAWIDRASAKTPGLAHRKIGHNPLEVARHFGGGKIDPVALAVATVHVDLDRRETRRKRRRRKKRV